MFQYSNSSIIFHVLTQKKRKQREYKTMSFHFILNNTTSVFFKFLVKIRSFVFNFYFSSYILKKFLSSLSNHTFLIILYYFRNLLSVLLPLFRWTLLTNILNVINFQTLFSLNEDDSAGDCQVLFNLKTAVICQNTTQGLSKGSVFCVL